MDKIFNEAKDKNVAAVIIYGKENDEQEPGIAYIDESCTIAMNDSDLKDAFFKRALIKIGKLYYTPSMLMSMSSENSVAYLAADASGDPTWKALVSQTDD